MGQSELEESSLMLDEKLLRCMEQLELLEEKRAALNSLIEQGWFSMSKARYSMGNKQVSALQYASEIEPLVHVHTRTLDNNEVEFCIERVTQKCNNESGKDVKTVEDIGPQEEGVRRRIKSKNNSTEKEETEKAGSERLLTKTEPSEVVPVIKRDQNPQQDPLKWFGILVPQTLKQAQSSFKQVIELSAEIASLQSAVCTAREDLKLSMKQKCALVEKTSAAQLDKVTD
ncbi:vacuolar ATPase assembly protein VMA22 [Myripristis murdjan]|uniref:Vacuolar ATPase assembly protein VMA22 n=1 Tax=Myripristis murdjan TaxID=586833 RepID=A0A667XN44_9TELE|nr:coiled-coil domain-containing protein 115 [Myripristis murdjan]